jgi:hypothetical protein
MKRRPLKWHLLLVLRTLVSPSHLHDSTKWPSIPAS